MASELVSDKVKERFKAIVKANALIQSKLIQAYSIYPVKRPYYFDLDKLWADPKLLDESVDLLEEVFKRIDQVRDFDTIVVWLSQVGSMGPIPLASILAQKLKKNLVVVRELQIQQVHIYPSTTSHSDLLKNKRVLVFKDVVLRAFTLHQLCHIVTNEGALLVATVVMVEVEDPDRVLLTSFLKDAFPVNVDPLVVSVLRDSEIEQN